MFKKLTCILQFTLILLNSYPAFSYLWVLNINDTITIKNAVDPEKTPEVVKYQLVAQNIRVKDENCTLEEYIKRTIPDKTEQRLKYGQLPIFTQQLCEQGVLEDDTASKVVSLCNLYDQAISRANHEHNGFFPSLFKLIKFIARKDPEGTIVFQSFGNEIPDALNYVKKHFSEYFDIDLSIAVFNEDGSLTYNNHIYTDFNAIRSLLKPGTVMG